ncbi:hypothetical protein FJ656_03265 [Schumannella luteola]|uniref:Uncharacterized protein YgbK (DUF1537 family) n=1 Tax=Schumannella luteola TaxID=472059 RepID=A0A852YAD4_9MICO|nr:four-carbon acid sugar kinase family protein [Schumannella luteola]NYG99443.1 uncharacterized protein YgbK (DUF1537 family) [Schumannella luteola]TPX06159.1 hypothetical protein FJ656_03265 [Schumannella luteola]
MKTIVLDDDPTGTQSATDAVVLLRGGVDALEQVLRERDSVYVQTNSRALHEADAVELVRGIRADGEEAARRLGAEVRFVLRGDSTLRGHVFAETEQFLDGDAVMVFLPAFPDGGRTTRGGVHFVRIGDQDLPAAETEYADDPVFPFADSALVDYVAAKSGRVAHPVDLEAVRAGGVVDALLAAKPGEVVVPDAVDADDIRHVAAAIAAAEAQGVRVVVRSASPLAAELAGVASSGLLATPLIPSPAPTLLVCGSHTAGATAQLAPIVAAWGDPAVVDTALALDDPAAAGRAAAEQAADHVADRGLAIVTTARIRSSEHGTLDHGEKVMAALTTAVRQLLPQVEVVISKGGITSAEVASTGIGATRAVVLGQVLPGVSVWRLTAHDGRELLYVVVPGNVGGPDTLERVVQSLGLRTSVQTA